MPVTASTHDDLGVPLKVVHSSEATHDDLGVPIKLKQEAGQSTATVSTKLSPDKEISFQEWRQKLPKNLQNDSDYDLRGIYNSNPEQKPSANLHLPDTYKKPNHITFSDESIYSKGINAGHWASEGGKDVFYASPINIKNAGGKDKLRQYFKEKEPDVKLVLPSASASNPRPSVSQTPTLETGQGATTGSGIATPKVTQPVVKPVSSTLNYIKEGTAKRFDKDERFDETKNPNAAKNREVYYNSLAKLGYGTKEIADIKQHGENVANAKQTLPELDNRIKKNPNDKEAHYLKGLVETDIGDYNAAIKSFQGSLKIPEAEKGVPTQQEAGKITTPQTTNSMAEYGIGYAFDKSGKEKDAMMYYQMALASDPNNENAYKALASHAFKNGDKKTSQQLTNAASEIISKKTTEYNNALMAQEEDPNAKNKIQKLDDVQKLTQALLTGKLSSEQEGQYGELAKTLFEPAAFAVGFVKKGVEGLQSGATKIAEANNGFSIDDATGEMKVLDDKTRVAKFLNGTAETSFAVSRFYNPATFAAFDVATDAASKTLPSNLTNALFSPGTAILDATVSKDKQSDFQKELGSLGDVIVPLVLLHYGAKGMEKAGEVVKDKFKSNEPLTGEETQQVIEAVKSATTEDLSKAANKVAESEVKQEKTGKDEDHIKLETEQKSLNEAIDNPGISQTTKAALGRKLDSVNEAIAKKETSLAEKHAKEAATQTELADIDNKIEEHTSDLKKAEKSNSNPIVLDTIKSEIIKLENQKSKINESKIQKEGEQAKGEQTKEQDVLKAAEAPTSTQEPPAQPNPEIEVKQKRLDEVVGQLENDGSLTRRQEKKLEKERIQLSEDINNLKTQENAAKERIIQENNQQKYIGANESPLSTTPSDSNQSIQSGEISKKEVGQSGTTGISVNARENRAAQTGIESNPSGEGWTGKEALDRGNELLSEGIDPIKMIENKDIELHDKVAIAQAHLNALGKETNSMGDKYGLDSKEYKDAIKNETDYLEQVKPLSTKSHLAFAAHQGEVEIDTGSWVGLARAFKERTGKELTPSQEAEAKDLSGKVKELTDKYGELQKKYTEAMDKWASEQDNAISEALKKERTKSLRPARKEELKKSINDRFQRLANVTFADSAPEARAGVIKEIGLLIKDVAELGGLELIDAISDVLKKAPHLKGIIDENRDAIIKNIESESGIEKNKQELTTRFVDKKDSKFDTQDVKDIWNHAKSEYLDKGYTYSEMVRGVSLDLGLTSKQVQDALAMPKGARVINDAMYMLQRNRRQAVNNAKYFVDMGNVPKWKKIIKSIPSFFFQKSVFGHTGVGMQTHAGMNIFDPTQWKNYFKGYVQQFKNLNKVEYEKSMENMTNDAQYVQFLRAGLDIDPNKGYSEYEEKPVLGKLGKVFKEVGEAGNRGFGALKIFRFEAAKDYYNKLSEVEKSDPNTIKNISEIINNATGVAKVETGPITRALLFAPRLIASRWNRLLIQPEKAIGILSDWSNATPAEKAAVKVTAKRAGIELAVMSSLLALNQGILTASGSDKKVNITDPTKPDWMRFRAGNTAIDLSGGMVGTAQFVARVIRDITIPQNELKGKKRREAIEIAVGNYAFNTISPITSAVAEPILRHDFNGNTVPWSDEKPLYKTAHKLTWKEYLWSQAPIPAAEAAKDMYTSMHENGMSELSIEQILTGIAKGVISGTTGARVMELNDEKKKVKHKTKP